MRGILHVFPIIALSNTQHISQACYSICDVSSWEDQVRLFEVGQKRYGRIDVVLANAGISDTQQNFEELVSNPEGPLKPDLKTLEVNLIGPIYTARLAMWHFMKVRSLGDDPDMLQALIFTGSASTFGGGSPLYSTTKAYAYRLSSTSVPDLSAFNVKRASRAHKRYQNFVQEGWHSGGLDLPILGRYVTLVSSILAIPISVLNVSAGSWPRSNRYAHFQARLHYSMARLGIYEGGGRACLFRCCNHRPIT